MRYKKSIGYKDTRVLLSDILPYETPPYFSNRYFYDFINKYKIRIEGEWLKVRKGISEEIKNQIIILFGLDFNNPNFNQGSLNQDFDYFKIANKHNETIPFCFKISHKDNDYRNLYLIHPYNQLEVVNFYKKYNSLMLYYSSISKYSLRKPTRISSLKLYKSATSPKYSNNEEFIEIENKEYRSLKTYFSYEKYSNIHKYYESYEFQNLEKKFNYLTKFDISRCFDSIYTHSIVWASINKKSVKDNIRYKSTFGHKFDELMQKHNYNETNGIVIGPEFSRIFAEIILQKVDHTVEKKLSKNHLIHKDYEIARYVDDYFIFYNEDKIKDEIISSFKVELQKYNLYFNESKTVDYSKPIITEISIAKEEIKKLLRSSAIFQFTDEKKGRIDYFSAKDIITNYKSLLIQTKTSYKDLQNYFLASIYNNLKKLIKEISRSQVSLIELYKKLRTQGESEELLLEIANVTSTLSKQHKQFTFKSLEIIELSFFIYTVLPRVSYCIKLCQILMLVIEFIKNSEKTVCNLKNKGINLPTLNKLIAFDFDLKHSVYKRIYDGILVVLNKKILSNFSEIETLYLIPIIEQLGGNYTLPPDILKKHFLNNESVNYFTITFLFTFIRRREIYKEIASELKELLYIKLKNYNRKDTEQLLLLFETLTNPYFGQDDLDLLNTRKNVLINVGKFRENSSKTDINNYIMSISKIRKMKFFDWNSTSFAKELNTKRGHEVY